VFELFDDPMVSSELQAKIPGPLIALGRAALPGSPAWSSHLAPLFWRGSCWLEAALLSFGEKRANRPV
jgi:hypothetical protein